MTMNKSIEELRQESMNAWNNAWGSCDTMTVEESNKAWQDYTEKSAAFMQALNQSINNEGEES
jgi:hypothetical protein